MFRNILLLVGCAAMLATTSPAPAQYYVPQGNVTDRNNMLGSGGINYGGASGFRPNQTNPYVTGNVTAGASFRGFSPIRDPNSFFLGSAPGRVGVGGLLPGLSGGVGSLPSDRLTTFRRDSVGIADIGRLPVAPTRAPLPYYSPSSTVTDTGQILRGLNQPGTSQLQSSYVPLQPDAYALPSAGRGDRPGLLGTPQETGGELFRTDTGQTLTGPINTRLLGSPLFANVRPLTGTQLTTPTTTPPTGQADLAERRLAQRRAAEGTMREPGEIRDRAVDPRSGQPLDRLLQRQEREAGRMGSPFDPDARPNGARAEDVSTQGPLSRRIGEREMPADQQEPTGRLATPLRRYDQDEASDLTAGTPRQTRLRAEDVSVPTFQGTAAERLESELDEAKELLAKKRYYDAARRYSMAQALDLDNPVPLLGRSMALLAAGDYLSSSNDLFQAIQVAGHRRAAALEFEEHTPDLLILDRRRASLEQQLELYEDFRLRFLLGWAEYISGMPDLGIANMTKAAKAMPENLENVQRFVEILAARQTTQPAPTATQPEGN